MRSIKLALKQNQAQAKMSPIHCPGARPSKKKIPDKNAKTQKKGRSIFLNSEEALIWIAKEPSRKTKNDLMQMIRKRTLEEGSFTHSAEEKSRMEITERVRTLPNSYRMSHEKERQLSLRVQLKEKKLMDKNRDSKTGGFFTIQALQSNSNVQRKSGRRLRIRTEKNDDENDKKMKKKPKVFKKQQIPAKMSLDQDSFHHSQLTPWD